MEEVVVMGKCAHGVIGTRGRIFLNRYVDI